jgi:murein hydrolase activator
MWLLMVALGMCSGVLCSRISVQAQTAVQKAQQKPAPASIRAEREKLRKLEAERRDRVAAQQKLENQASQLKVAIQQSTEKMVDVAAQIQKREQKLDRVEDKLDLLATERANQLAALGKRRTDVVRLLAALQNLSRQPPQLLLVRPNAAIDTARSAALLKLVVPQLEAQTSSLKKDIAALNAVKADLDTERETYRIELASLSEDRETLKELRAAREEKRTLLLDQAGDEQAKAQTLAAQARDVKDLLAQLEKTERKRARLAALPGPRLRPDFTKAPLRAVPPPKSTTVTRPPVTGTPPLRLRPPVVAMTPALPRTLGLGTLPARGDIITGFGGATANGPSRGLSIRTRPDATVTAPAAGRVVFAGPFRAYGQMLIISHGEGYHSLIAGLTRLDAKNQQMIQAGEPVGIMGSGGEQTALYFELRRGGDAVNPAGWLVAKR